MSKWTPGPWFIRAERYRFIQVRAHGGGIAHLDTIDGEGAANARLIAAAPEMAELLADWLRDSATADTTDSPLESRARALLSRIGGDK